MNKAVLAFSGGLDTSFCVKYLINELGLEVHTVTINTGGFTGHELIEIEARAYALGAATHETLDESQSFYRDCIRFLVFGNVLKNNTYPLSVSAERVCQATAVARYAALVGADYIVHGSTGAGNDQVRFDMIFNILLPGVSILTPIRDNKLSREEEIEYLHKHGYHISSEKAKYSINKGIWGTSVGGRETLTSHESLPDEAYQNPLTEEKPRKITLLFEKGELVGVDDIQFEDRIEAICYLDSLSAPYAIGRDTHVGDTIIGIKGRVGFEAPAPLIIIKSHHTLEKHVLTKWQLYWKDQLASWYGNWLHEGQFLDPVMRNIEKLMEDMQQNVSGKVFVMLLPYRFQVLGIESPHDLMHARFGSYGEMNNAWTGEDVRGFAKIFGNQAMIYHSVNTDKNIDIYVEPQ